MDEEPGGAQAVEQVLDAGRAARGWTSSMFERFTEELIDVGDAVLRVRHGGRGRRSCSCTATRGPTPSGTASHRG